MSRSVTGMDELEFRRSLHQGLGRAIVYARQSDISGYREAILDALLHCYSGDTQCEGTRAPFMYDLIAGLPDRDIYRKRVLASLEAGGDDANVWQRFRLATYMAMDGDEEARSAVYRHFAPGPEYGVHIALGFVDLDGLEGFLFAARKLAAEAERGEDARDLDWLWSHAKEKCGDEQATAALEEAAALHPDLQTFRTIVLDNTRRTQRAEKARERRQRRDSIAGGASRADLSTLMEWAQGVDIELADAAMRALAEVVSGAVREFALRMVAEASVIRGECIHLLARNSQPGDHELVLRWFEQEENVATRHRMGMGLRRFWEMNPNPQTEPKMLRTIYALGPCSMCREFAVARMVELDVMTEELRAECAFDANDEVRKMVGAE